MDFILNFAESVEEFFTTPLATLIGAVFLVASTVLILLLIRKYEKK